jgi:hypothetical protein
VQERVRAELLHDPHVIIDRAAADGHTGFSEYWLGGARDRAERTRQWYVDTTDALQEALR